MILMEKEIPWEDDYNEEEANRARRQMMDDYYEIYNEL